jgi:hypothetical protein
MAYAKALDHKWLTRENNKVFWRKEREKLVALRKELRDARAQRKEAMKAASERCRSERLAARERARALRVRGLAELREAVRLERETAKKTCGVEKTAARSKEPIERRRAEIEAERRYHRELRLIDRGHRQRRREHPHATYIERRAESDDEVRANLSPELVPLFERIKRGINGSPRKTRTEQVMEYAEANPREVLEVLDEGSDRLVRELEARERDMHRSLSARRRASRIVSPSERQLEEVPF